MSLDTTHGPYTYRGQTRSLCPECRRVVEAKIVTRGQRVYFRKQCPEHGLIEDYVHADVARYDRHEHSQPARQPQQYGTAPDRGCPYDCGLCSEHEQHTCVALVEVTSSCNLTCPMCYATSAPGGTHLDWADYERMIARLVALEGEADVLQLSGGEPTLHPRIVDMVAYAYERPIGAIMLNTNGIRLGRDPKLVEALAAYRDRFEVYLQFDGFDETTHMALRGEPLQAAKAAALDALEAHGIRTTLVCTVDHRTNQHELGRVLAYGLSRPWVRGVSYQTATYCGRHDAPGDLEGRATLPDVVDGLVAQSAGLLAASDFYPLPCAHPNCHMMAYLYRGGDDVVPVSRFIDVESHMALLANSIIYTPDRARDVVAAVLARLGVSCCGPAGCGPEAELDPRLAEFAAKAMADGLDGEQVFRITLTAFLDAHTFDTRRVMKCCIGHLLPSGHMVPFCAYNTLYRDGHLPLPPLVESPATAPVES